jgi:hypothetical protein
MFAVHYDKIDRSVGQRLREFCGAFWEQLVVMGDRFALPDFIGGLHDEVQRNAMLRELSLLNDHCLKDIGRTRAIDQRTTDLVKRLRAGG